MKRNYIKPQLDVIEVVSEQGFVQSDFNSGFIVPGGTNNGGEDDWA